MTQPEMQAQLTTERDWVLARITGLEAEEEALNATLAGREQKVDIAGGEGDSASVERGAVRTRRQALDARLTELDAAISALAEGLYGLCVSCGGDIPAERLAAMPGALECVACRQAASRRR